METRNYNHGTVTGGLVLIALGLAFFAATQGFLDLSWGNIWPIFLIIAGAATLLQALNTPDLHKRGNTVVGATGLLLVGAFFLATTTGLLSWADQGTLWPIYPAIIGVSLFAGYLASGMTERNYVIPATILTLVGLAFLAVIWIGSYDLIGKLWPIFLIIAGVIMLIAPRARRANL